MAKGMAISLPLAEQARMEDPTDYVIEEALGCSYCGQRLSKRESVEVEPLRVQRSSWRHVKIWDGDYRLLVLQTYCAIHTQLQ